MHSGRPSVSYSVAVRAVESTETKSAYFSRGRAYPALVIEDAAIRLPPSAYEYIAREQMQSANERLIATTPSGRRYSLYSESLTKFFLKEIDVQSEFVRDTATNKVTEFLMTQDGTEKRVARD